ncbi:MAG: hypothetical protein RDU14_16825 [Melioribacteraceae bacterium]|nr:hypothetical protein [Melioribacteraceae bacterium]
MKLEYKIIAVLSLLLAGVTFFLIKSTYANKQLEKIYKQNELALNDTLKTLHLQNETYYHKYASIQSKLTEKDKQLKERDEKILTMSTKEISLRKLIDSLSGTIVKIGKDSAGIPYGSVLEFKKNNEFYWSKDSVFIERPPWIKKELGFIKFKQKDFLTRNKEGKWSGYSKYEPEFVNKYLSIKTLEVIVDRDEFVRVESDIDKFRLSLIPTIGLLQKESSLLGGGLKALINKKHLVEVTKGIGNDWSWIGYGYSFDIVK